MPQPPLRRRSNSVFPSPGSERPPASGNVSYDSDLQAQPPVLPSNGPSGGLNHHHHYIPTPSDSGHGTPTRAPSGASNGPPVPNYDTPGPRHSQAPFPGADHHGPSSHSLPIFDSPQLSHGRHTPASEHRPPHPPGEQLLEFMPTAQPPLPPQYRPSAQGSPSQAQPYPPSPTEPIEPLEFRSLTGDEVRRTQRFMSLNWRVGVINHRPPSPTARRTNPPPSQPAAYDHQPQGPASGSGSGS